MTSFRLSEQLAHDIVYGLWVGLAASGAHYLADEKFEYAFVAGPEFRYVVRILFDDFASGLFDGGGVADLREPFGGDDFGGSTPGFKHGGEYFFADGGGDLAEFDEFQELGER